MLDTLICLAQAWIDAHNSAMESISRIGSLLETGMPAANARAVSQVRSTSAYIVTLQHAILL